MCVCVCVRVCVRVRVRVCVCVGLGFRGWVSFGGFGRQHQPFPLQALRSEKPCAEQLPSPLGDALLMRHGLLCDGFCARSPKPYFVPETLNPQP